MEELSNLREQNVKLQRKLHDIEIEKHAKEVIVKKCGKKIHQFKNFTILDFDWHFSNEKFY